MVVRKFSSVISLLMPVLWAGGAHALPSLQLDILGGTYNNDTETVVTSTGIFTLYAYGNLGNKQGNGNPVDLDDRYYVSAAVINFGAGSMAGDDDGNPDAVLALEDFGSFTITGPDDMGGTDEMFFDYMTNTQFGTAPVEALQGSDAGDLQKHGIFETTFGVYDADGFQFDKDMTRDAVNVQDNPGTAISGPGTLAYVPFTVNVMGLSEGYGVHFDLYSQNVVCAVSLSCLFTDVDRNDFAPFSKDAECCGRDLSEPGTLGLMMIGMIGVGASRIRRRRSGK